MTPSRIVVMGVAGAGKSEVGRLIAERRGARFLEGDDFHPTANIEKMSSGKPLTDDDRWPWLAALRQAMRAEDDVVVSCSALKRSHRDALRSAGQVRFLYLAVTADQARQRVALRRGHFFGVSVVGSQFEALESPGADETDVATISAGREPPVVAEEAHDALQRLEPTTAVAPLLATAGATSSLEPKDVEAHLADAVREAILGIGAQRILLVPPDMSRRDSGAGEITASLFTSLEAAGCDVTALPALGTHRAMSPEQVSRLFGGRVPYERVLPHRWREGLVRTGVIGSAEVSALSAGRMTDPIAVEVDAALLENWDLVVSIGQVVPHEVAGMANFTKNLVIGLGGSSTVNGTHFLSALCGIERVMGRAQNPVRDLVDAAYDRFLAPRMAVLWILTVVQSSHNGTALRGLFMGRGGSGESGGAAYRQAAALSAVCNIAIVPRALDRVSCWMDADEFPTTWLANKAVYRTRMALADGAELLVLAPGVSGFGEDPTVDSLIRRHGYRGGSAVMAAVAQDLELAGNLGTAAHLIHGSNEGRFRVIYCTDPASGGISPSEVEAVGYEWRSLPEVLERLGVNARTADGERRDSDGSPFFHIARPAVGLWSTADRMEHG